MNPISSKQTGFTLIELLTVMLILVAMASVTIETTSELAFQNRYEVTKDRYEKIKQAIIGRPDVLINGQPDISGFVADMGRLPINIHDLLEEDYCLTNRTIPDSATCGVGWRTQGINWTGPYLSITKGPSEANAFPDGWGNLPTAYCTNLNNTTAATCIGPGETWYTEIENHNYGWYYFVDTTVTPNTLSLFSLGKDQALGGVAPDYDAEFPSTISQPVINGNDWTVDISTASANVLADFAGNCTAQDITNHSHSVCNLYDGTWDNVTSTCRTRRMTLNNVCTEISATWDAVTNSCSVPAVTTITHENICTTVNGTYAAGPPSTCAISPITLETQCPIIGGTWNTTPDPDECQNIPLSRNHCRSDIAEDAWNYSNQDICIKIIRNFAISRIMPNQSITEDGLQHSLLFPNDTNIPMGNIIGIIHNDTNCTSPAIYNTDRQNSICINNPDNVNFTQANCEGSNGTWINDGIEQYCNKVIGPNCTATLGGTEAPKFTMSLVPNTTLSTLKW